MTTTKIRIDLSQGIVEAEGTENFVRAIYDDFRSKLEVTESAENTDGDAKGKKKTVKKKASANKTKKPASKRAVPSIVKELDLSGGGKKKRLRDFYNQYKAGSNFEKNLIFVYYLTHELGMSGITTDHVFTCYRDIPGIKAPNALRQSLLDTSNRRGWLDTSSTEDIKVTMPGINYLEHDMPKAASDS